MARKFLFVCAGLLCLAGAYALGARNAGAQAPSNPVVAAFSGVVITANGDVYCDPGSVASYTHWVRASNVFASGPVPTEPATLGQVKVRYR